jgi:hypothetical protein
LVLEVLHLEAADLIVVRVYLVEPLEIHFAEAVRTPLSGAVDRAVRAFIEIAAQPSVTPVAVAERDVKALPRVLRGAAHLAEIPIPPPIDPAILKAAAPH